ncbi:sugar phosphate isomerase/epimerase family protein [uncultured Arcticibacterium sp.]|uniref:sugar phosphate isomerase/epimerase family protein n=1 Tax=uncultured Arcticibacterium sp. TaxID=2173042 RepID=UPI0030F5C821
MQSRRKALKTLATLPVLMYSSKLYGQSAECFNLKTSLNAFSFNNPLTKGEINLFQVIDYCVKQKFDAIDITGYYFPEYPKVPSDDYIFAIKKKAQDNGLEISGTGVRNDFTNPDKTIRNEHIQLVKNWIQVAQKLGAPVIRIFAGNDIPDGYTWEETAEWMVEDFKECVNFGKKHGVVVAVQNHNDFIRTPEHVHYLFKKVDNPWFGLIMDTGGYRSGKTYEDIASTIKYAVNWQIKEKIFVNGQEMDTDIPKLLDVIKKSCYKGYIPIETLGDGDVGQKVTALMEKIRKSL